MPATNIDAFFDEIRRDTPSQLQDDDTNPAALPDRALSLLKKAVETCGIHRVFEFGSGRSTHCFLQSGCHVTSIEDSQSWAQATRDHVDQEHRANLDLRWSPLQRVWLKGAPYEAWKLPPDLRANLQKAELVLIDPPLYTGFRETVLFQVLDESSHQLVVLDDLRIPGLADFCDRLAAANPALIYHHSVVGHEMGFFWKTEADKPLRFPFRFSWWVRAWRRYWIWLVQWRHKHQHT